MITLGIDSGTQSTKCIALDAETGEVLASASSPCGLIGGLPPGHMEQHPGDWVDAMDRTVREVLGALGDRRGEVFGIGVSGQQHGFVALDRDGQVIRAAKLWCDTSTVAECEEFEREFGGKEGLIAKAGNAMLPGYTAPKVLWMKKNEPGHFRELATILLPHDYLNFVLTGEKAMEYGDASGTGFMDVRSRKWCGELCDFVDGKVRGCLPEVRHPSTAVGLLRNRLAKAWGLSGEVVVSAGGGDNMMGAIGTGNVAPGVVTASFGTSGTLYAYAESATVDEEGEVAAFCDSTGGWLPLVCTMNVTVATEQARKLFGWGVEELNRAVAEARPGAEGVLFLPYLNGERTPNYPKATAVFLGLTAGNATPGNLARAMMEGATLGLAYGLGRFRELGVVPTEIRVTGGGSKSAVWRQLAADVFGVATVCLESAEGAALGAAVQAVWTASAAAGKGQALREIVRDLVRVDEGTRCEPDAARLAIYRELLKRHTTLARRLHEAGQI